MRSSRNAPISIQIMLQKLNNSSKEHAFRSSGNAAIAIQHIENYMSNNIAE